MPGPGRLGWKDKIFIRKNAPSKSIDDIAASLNKLPATIEKWMLENGVQVSPTVLSDKTDKEYIRKALHNSMEWSQLKKQLNKEELDFFEHRFIRLMQQFKGDVLATEESQLFILIKYEIMMNRNMIDKEKVSKELTKLLNAIDDWHKDPESKKNPSLLDSLEQRAISLRSSMDDKSLEYVKLQEKYSQVLTSIKGARDQRITNIENSKETYLGLVKKLQEEVYQDKEGQMLALMQRATAKEHKRLSKPHKYMDGMTDLPILSAETLEQLENA